MSDVDHVQIDATSRHLVHLVCIRCGTRKKVSPAPLRSPTRRMVEQALRVFEVEHINCPKGFWFGSDRRMG